MRVAERVTTQLSTKENPMRYLELFPPQNGIATYHTLMTDPVTVIEFAAALADFLGKVKSRSNPTRKDMQRMFEVFTQEVKAYIRAEFVKERYLDTTEALGMAQENLEYVVANPQNTDALQMGKQAASIAKYKSRTLFQDNKNYHPLYSGSILLDAYLRHYDPMTFSNVATISVFAGRLVNDLYEVKKALDVIAQEAVDAIETIIIYYSQTNGMVLRWTHPNGTAYNKATHNIQEFDTYHAEVQRIRQQCLRDAPMIATDRSRQLIERMTKYLQTSIRPLIPSDTMWNSKLFDNQK